MTTPAAVSTGAAIALGLGLSAGDAHAATFTVTNLNDSGAGSLRQAVDDANNALGPDIIIFDSNLSGTITITNGEYGIHDSVEITGADGVSIDGNGGSRIFYIISEGPLEVTISELRLTGGIADGEVDVGGAIFAANTLLELTSVVIEDNAAGDVGGGVFLDGGSAGLVISKSTISGNYADSAGGGIYVGETGAPVTIVDSQILDNVSEYGGGILIDEPGEQVIIDRTTISGNTGTEGGGGLFFYESQNYSNVIIRNSTISNNTSGDRGGGIFFYNPGEGSRIENCTISGNHADDHGGGVMIFEPSYVFTVAHSTIVNNSATNFGGGFDMDVSPAIVTHSIIANNTAPMSADLDGEIYLDYSLAETVSDNTDDRGNNIIEQDPLLGPLQDNGGPTLTHSLLSGSPAINAGNPAISGAPTYDQRGEPHDRIYNEIDLGAVELVQGQLQFSMVTQSVGEGAGTVTVTVTRVDGSDGAVGVDYESANGTALSTSDYTTASGSLSWADGDDESKTFSISIADDSEVETAETLTAALSDPTGGATLGTDATVTITITDNDVPVNQPPTVSSIGPQVVHAADAPRQLAFTVGDEDDEPSSLVVSAASSNQTLLPNANLVVGGTGVDRTITVTPVAGQSGTATITITVGDGASQVTSTFSVTFVRDGASGAQGSDGLSIASRSTKIDPGQQCAAGGVHIEMGRDDNRDGVLQDEEVEDSKVVCNGPAGASGAPGAAGPRGEQGEPGEPGYSAVFDIVPIEPGDKDCSAGGVTVQIGLDDGDGSHARNGELDEDEVDTERNVCLTPADVVLGGGSAAGSCSVTAPGGASAPRGLWALGLGIVALFRRRRNSRRAAR